MRMTGQPQYRAIFDNAFEAIAVVDVEGAILSANRAVEKTFGYKPKELLGRHVGLLVPGRHARRRGDDASGLRAFTHRGRHVDGRRKDGSLFPLDLSVAEWQRNGETFFTGIMRDVSGPRDAAAERRVAGEALRDSEERLRLLQNDFAHLSRVNELGEMAAAIAHEINQPLSAIENYLSGGLMLVNRESTADALAAAHKAMTLAAEQGMRAGAIVRGLREFVCKGEGARQIERADTLVESAMTLALIDIYGTGIEIDYRPAGPGVAVEVDPVQIQQVLVNLLRNAIEAMSANPPGAVRRLSVETRELAGEGAVEFRVADSGPGILPGLAGRLFDPFVTSKAKGMGMGLSICRRIVEAHEGTIAVDADEGTGASFRVRLPRASIGADGQLPLSIHPIEAHA
jgi:two-component system sensor kinase FixL